MKMTDVTTDITSYVILHHTIYGPVDFGYWHLVSMVEEGCGRGRVVWLARGATG